MDKYIMMERLRSQKKSPALLWLLNILWAGLGNMVVGQPILGVLFGLLQLVLVCLTILTFGVASFLLFFNWLVASGVGHNLINSRYDQALMWLESGCKGSP